jgi:hypothetical protein
MRPGDQQELRREIDGQEIPQRFIWPITREVMKDPVIMPDGHHSERSAIAAALDNNSVSPIRREKMSIDNAMSDRHLKAEIEASNFATAAPEIAPLHEFDVIVRTIADQSHRVKVKPEMTIEELFAVIQAKIGYHCERLLHGTKQLATTGNGISNGTPMHIDDHPEIRNGSILHAPALPMPEGAVF